MGALTERQRAVLYALRDRGGSCIGSFDAQGRRVTTRTISSLAELGLVTVRPGGSESRCPRSGVMRFTPGPATTELTERGWSVVRGEGGAQRVAAPWRVTVGCVVEVPCDEALTQDAARDAVHDALRAVSDHSRGRSVGYEESALAGEILDALVAATKGGAA